jgi:hypothetical protein
LTGASLWRGSLNRGMQDAERIDPIVLDGQLVALAGPRRCYLLTDDLTPEEVTRVAAMCLCSREVRAGRLNGPFTTELAERWTELYTSRER